MDCLRVWRKLGDMDGYNFINRMDDMTPFEIGLSAFYICVSIISSLGLAYFIYTVLRGVNGIISWYEYKSTYKNFMQPDYWFFQKANQPPNPDFINLVYKNSASRENIELSVLKEELRKLI